MLGENTNVHDVLHQPEGVQQPGACILTTTMATIGRAKAQIRLHQLALASTNCCNSKQWNDSSMHSCKGSHFEERHGSQLGACIFSQPPIT